MPAATANAPNLTDYFKLDGSRDITGPTNIYNGTAASAVLTLRGAAGQSGNLLTLQSSAPADLVGWKSDGRQAASLTFAGSGLEDRYAIDRAITFNPTTGQNGGGGRLVLTVPAGQDTAFVPGYYVVTVVNGRATAGYGVNVGYFSNSGSAQTSATGVNSQVVHSGAGLLADLAGMRITTSSSTPVTDHYGLKIGSTVTGATGSLIGLDVTVTGTATTKYAARFTGDTYVIGNPRLSGYFQRLDTNEYRLTFGRNSTYGTAQLSIIDAGTANKGFSIAAVGSDSIIGVFKENGTLAQMTAAVYNGDAFSANGSAALKITGGTSGGVTVSDYAAASVVYLTMLNKTHTYVDGSSMVFGTSTGMKFGTATTQKLSFWNAVPVTRPVLATGAGATVDNVITVLQTLGLVGQT